MVDKKYFFRLALNQSRDALPMTRSHNQGFQDQQIERALQQGNAVVVARLGCHPTQVLAGWGRMSTQRAERESDQSMLTARAASKARVAREMLDWIIMSTLAQRERTGESVGEKAVLVLNARKR